ncbi:thioesterase domain-containing protein [Arthrobacter sp. 131MFCol6.1]|jgi:pimeloyl-ACP methyl ester carboxylesterase|uniref:thioesterase domain-containing protein n=1 Tax=Arthrobacter sp. 131MFCol6.1 TaxID=1157944 RepID=UPI0004757ABF|nr:thioesterase domain-containing protein [Arthrobacter sp. 131MFCol6.1]
MDPNHPRGPGASEARMLRRAVELKRVSRRSFLIGAGSASLLAADMLFTQRVQAERRASRILEVPDDVAERYYPHASWILFPGYKTSWEEALWILNALRGSLNKRGQLAAVGYSNEGLDIDEVVIAVIEHVRAHNLTTLYFYGHSFGGMVATQVAARLRELHGVEVAFILLDSSPSSRHDVLDQSWFEGVVLLYESGFRFPTVLRGGYELGERMLHKNERSWGQVVDQTLEQLSPIAPSSVLIQSESAYIYHFEASRFIGKLGETKMAFIGNPRDKTVDYETARDTWSLSFKANMASDDLRTDGARPEHASPGWSPFIYRPIIEKLQDGLFPLPGGGGKKTAF